jgi:hypothetical protein
MLAAVGRARAEGAGGHRSGRRGGQQLIQEPKVLVELRQGALQLAEAHHR